MKLAIVAMLGFGLAASPQNAAAGNAQNGKRIYTSYGCYQCHGRQGQGSPATGSRLGPGPVPFAAFVAYVRNPAGQMPPYTTKIMSDAELADVYSFLESLPQPPAAKSIPLLNLAGPQDRLRPSQKDVERAARMLIEAKSPVMIVGDEIQTRRS